MFPEIAIVSIWTDKPELIASLMVQYFASSIILELCYRWFVWGGLYTTEQTSSEGRQDCPDNPWISLLDRYPDTNDAVKVFCADGKERFGKTVKREDGYMGIVLELSREDAQKYKNEFWMIRPTHWRSIKKENIEDDNW